MENNAEELHELYKEELRKQLDQRMEQDWATQWSSFGEYEPNPLGKGSKIRGSLAASISQKTGGSMSAATIKRFISNEKSTKEENLDLICAYLGYKDYTDFKTKNTFVEQQIADYQDYFQVNLLLEKGNFQIKRIYLYVFSVFIFAGLTAVGLMTYHPVTNEKTTSPNNATQFKLLHKSGKTSPAVYFLGVDLSGIDYDSAYVSFNIDPRERNIPNDQKRLLVKKAIDTLEYVVYKPEIIFAQLIVDGVSYGAIRLVTYSDDWDGYYSSFLPETNNGWEDPLASKEKFRQNGKLQYQREHIYNAKHKGYFYGNFLKVADFGINFSEADLLFNVRNSAKYGGISCFEVSIHIYDDVGNTLNYCVRCKGCAMNMASFNGIEIPLTFEERDKLTQDLNEWTNVKLQTKGNKANVYINGEYRATLPIPNKMGKLMQVKIDVKGMGEINYVDFKDTDGNVYYEDFGAVLKEG
jgi:hypothetical protein